MNITPGRTDGGRPRIGERVELRVPDATLARIDMLVAEADMRYSRVPRELRSRTAVIRACLEGGLGALEARVAARPTPDDEG